MGKWIRVCARNIHWLGVCAQHVSKLLKWHNSITYWFPKGSKLYVRDVEYTRQYLISILGPQVAKRSSVGPNKDALIALFWACPREPGCGPPSCAATNHLMHYADDVPDTGWKIRPCPVHEPLFPELRDL
jgi:hypothetical protein